MRRYLVIIPLFIIIGLLVIFSGCGKDIKGPARDNIAPIVNFVNIPAEGARFSSDPVVYWYGTDPDGFIDSFYYAVIEESVVGPDPDGFISGGGLPPDDESWNGIAVELDNTGTNSRIQMSADIRDPVRTYITSYVFLVAVDNLGMRSNIVYRTFAKNNHFPNTMITAQGRRDPYINAVRPGPLLDGVTFGFSGDDRVDYPRNPPPFEYRWKIYGPFDDSLINVIDSAYVCSTFVDIYGQFYRSGDTLRIFSRLDTTVVADTLVIDSVWNYFPVDGLTGGNPYGFWSEALLGILPRMDSLALDTSDHYRLAGLTLFDEYLVDSSSSGWSYDATATVYDLFREQNIPPAEDTTRTMSFMVWCQVRDDARVPDPVPEFTYITVIEPKFERDVVIVDAGSYDRASVHNWPIFPRDPWALPDLANYPLFPDTSGPAIRDVLGEFINNWKPGSFDAEAILPDDTIWPDDHVEGALDYLHVTRKWRNGTTQDYYPIRAIDAFVDSGYTAVNLREILKHKIILIVKDNTANSIGFETAEGMAIVDGINSGLNAWILARAAAGEGHLEAGNRPAIDAVLQNYFGILALQQTGWQERTNLASPRIEDFVGAISLEPATFPSLNIDLERLENFYLWDSTRCDDPELPCYPFRDLVSGEIIVGAMPEVGYLRRRIGTEALYLYKSKYGTNPPYYIDQRQGTVVAIRYNTPYFRTAHFCFNLMAMDEVTAQQVFNTMMDWLSYQPYINTGKINAGVFGTDANRLKDISRRMHDLRTQGLLPNISQTQ